MRSCGREKNLLATDIYGHWWLDRNKKLTLLKWKHASNASERPERRSKKKRNATQHTRKIQSPRAVLVCSGVERWAFEDIPRWKRQKFTTFVTSVTTASGALGHCMVLPLWPRVWFPLKNAAFPTLSHAGKSSIPRQGWGGK